MVYSGRCTALRKENVQDGLRENGVHAEYTTYNRTGPSVGCLITGRPLGKGPVQMWVSQHSCSFSSDGITNDCGS